MQNNISSRWKHTEFILRTLTKSCQDMYDIPLTKTWRPFSVLATTGNYQYPSQFQRQTKVVQSYFLVYMAIIGYMIAVMEEVDGDVCGDNAMPTWFIKLDNYDQALLSGLHSSILFTYLAERAGTFLNIAEPPINQFSVDFLIKYCVPVWYPWGPKEISKAKHDCSFDRLAPPYMAPRWQQRFTVAVFFYLLPIPVTLFVMTYMLTKSEAEAICGRVNCYTGTSFSSFIHYE